jgi:hypothetical protein
MSKSMPLSEALARVRSKNGTEQDLQAKLMYGEVRAESLRSTDSRFSDSPYFTDGTEQIPLLFWHDAEIDWANGSVTKSAGNELARYRKEHQHVHVPTTDIDRLWPADPSGPSERLQTKDRGGRPSKYEWAAAAGFLAAWLMAHGEPETSAALISALQRFFERIGKSPNDRDIRKFVTTCRNEYKREMDRGN